MIILGGVKPNAFLNPNNPNAVFPKTKKEEHIDFRSTAIENSGLTVRFTSRKNAYNTKNLSQYAAIVKTKEDLEAEEKLEKQKEQEKIENELNLAVNKMENIELDQIEDEDMKVDHHANMRAKDKDSISIKKSKRKSSKKVGNKRRLLF